MLLDQARAAAAQHVAQDERHQDRIVEVARDRDEVRHEVDRHGEVGHERREHDLLASRDAWVADEAPEEEQAVRDESRDRASRSQRPASMRPPTKRT